jgi:hypothetical protein
MQIDTIGTVASEGTVQGARAHRTLALVICWMKLNHVAE